MFNKKFPYHDSGEQTISAAPPPAKQVSPTLRQVIIRNLFAVTIFYCLLIQIANVVVDDAVGITKFFPPINLERIYKPPYYYDNIPRIRVRLSFTERLAIESNRRFRFLRPDRNYAYADSIPIAVPDSIYKQNNFYFNFEGSKSIDSMHLLVTRNPGGFFRQITYCSAEIYDVNNILPVDTVGFRVNSNVLVASSLLENNDTLVDKAFTDFNSDYRTNPAGDCGTLSRKFMDICGYLNLPCRLVGVHGGDHFETGFINSIGFPVHLMCELYSSRHKKWYVVDPLYGVRFKNPVSSDFMNAVEINGFYKAKSQDALVLDSVLVTQGSLLPANYYQFYDNIYYPTGYAPTKLIAKVMTLLFAKYNYSYYHYAHSMASFGDRSYLFLKIAIYFVLSVLYIITLFSLVIRKLSFFKN